MAVLQMQRINICALKKDRKAILETLQRRGVVEICDLSSQDNAFQKDDTSDARSQFEKTIVLANQALETLDVYAPEKSSLMDMFNGREAITTEQYQTYAQKAPEIEKAASEIVSLAKKVAENKAEILKLQAQIDALAPWMGLDVSMQFSGTRCTAAFIGSFPEQLNLEQIYEKLAQAAPEVTFHIEIFYSSRDLTCIIALVPRQQAAAAEEALRGMGFAKPASPPKEPPKEYQAILERQITDAAQIIDSATETIASHSAMREPLHFLVDYCTMRMEKYDAISRLLNTRRTFFLSGYIAKVDAPALEAELSKNFDIALEFVEPTEDEDVPCLLRNNKFTEPVTGVLESYGLPQRGEIDPTPIMAFFYYFLFGLMFSDFGYGALLAIGTGILLLKCKNMEPGTRRMIKLFFFCGISTAAWGIVFSSYFGDVVDIVSSTFFGREVTIPPLWFAPLDDPMKMLVFSMTLGVIHLFTGLGIQFYQHVKAHNWYAAITKVILWYMLVGGLIVFGLSTEMFTSILQLTETLPAAVGSVAGWIAAIGAVGIVFTNGESKNPFVRFAQGLYELYNVTGYLSDILSYSRLLALGLATGVVGSVINQMGSMGGNGIPGVILFVLVFLIGHTINFGIELLGAYVHCNRLQFVEFFGKFYEGGRRKFEPLGVHTKYYKFKEDN